MGKMLNWKNDVCPPTKDRALARSQSAAWVLPPPCLGTGKPVPDGAADSA